MNQPLTELQQFFGAYFNQDWMEGHSSADDVIDSFLKNSSKDIIITVKQGILEMINSYTNESVPQEKPFQEQYCYYDYPHQ